VANQETVRRAHVPAFAIISVLSIIAVLSLVFFLMTGVGLIPASLLFMGSVMVMIAGAAVSVPFISSKYAVLKLPEDISLDEVA
jgi:hypothetical protein